MKKWIMFLAVPVLILWLLEFLAAVIFGGFFQIEHNSFWSGVAKFATHFIGGVALLHWAPNKNSALAYLFAAIYSAIGFYLGISTDGNVMEIMGESVVQDFSFLQELASTVGIFGGIFGAVESEKEEQLVGVKPHKK